MIEIEVNQQNTYDAIADTIGQMGEVSEEEMNEYAENLIKHIKECVKDELKVIENTTQVLKKIEGDKLK